MPLTWSDCGTISWSVAPSVNPSLTSSLQAGAGRVGKVGLVKLFLQQTQPFYYLEGSANKEKKGMLSGCLCLYGKD